MSVVNTIKEKLQQAKEKSQTPLNFIKIDDQTREVRLSICQSCEFLFEPTGSCKKCGCFVKAKTWLTHTSCPEGKW